MGQLAIVETGHEGARRAVSTDAELLGVWLHGRSANTRLAYTREAVRFLAWAGAPLRSVTLPGLQDYADHLAALCLKPASQARALAVVKSLLSKGAKVGYLPTNVGAALELPALRGRRAERIVSREVIARLIAGETAPRKRTLLRVLYYGGLRVSEACDLRWRDVAPRDGGTVQVTVFGKGAKTRAVLLPADFAQELAALRGEAGEDAPVFTSPAGGPLSAAQAYRIVKAAGKRAGVPAISPHWLRHALASHALEDGADIAIVSDTLGHASLLTTSLYVHARPNDSAGLHLRPLPAV